MMVVPTTHPCATVLTDAPGPFVTAYLPTESAVTDARERLLAEARAAENELADAGGDPKAIERLVRLVQESEHGAGDHLVVVANRDGAWSWPSLGPLERVRVYASALPRVAPLLAAHQDLVPHLLVVMDREGADIETRAGAHELAAAVVHGDTEHIHRGQPGGWSQRRFQQRAENTWEHNAADVAEMVDAAFVESSPAIVAVAGDERAVGFLLDHVTEDVRRAVVKLEHGGRAEGADRGHLLQELDEHLARHRESRRAESIEKFGTRMGNQLAVEGAAETLAALFQRRADELLVVTSLDDGRTAFHGPEPSQVAATAAELEAIELDATEGPLIETAVRAAVASGCEIQFLPADAGTRPAEGIGATLRG